MTRLPLPGETVLTIGEYQYTQAQAGELAFKCYLYTRKNLEAGFLTWNRLAIDSDLTQRDWLFLALYYLSEVADDRIREAYAEDLEFIKEAVQTKAQDGGST